MKIDKEIFREMTEDIEELEQYFNERIQDLYDIKGAHQGRHAYIFYRTILWRIKYNLRDKTKSE